MPVSNRDSDARSTPARTANDSVADHSASTRPRTLASLRSRASTPKSQALERVSAVRFARTTSGARGRHPARRDLHGARSAGGMERAVPPGGVDDAPRVVALDDGGGTELGHRRRRGDDGRDGFLRVRRAVELRGAAMRREQRTGVGDARAGPRSDLLAEWKTRRSAHLHEAQTGAKLALARTTVRLDLQHTRERVAVPSGESAARVAHGADDERLQRAEHPAAESLEA